MNTKLSSASEISQTTTTSTATTKATAEARDRPHRVVSPGLLIGIVLVAANLRTPLTGVGALLPTIQHDKGVSEAWSGLLNTLPLLTFAVTSPLVARASHRFGTAKLLVAALVALVAGTVVRSLPSVFCLFAGTVVLSAAIAFGNVVLPALIRRNVPAERIHSISALYVTVMGLTAAVSSGISLPLAHVLPGSWRTSLAWGVVFSVVALVVWIPRVRSDNHQVIPGATRSPIPWRSRLAWQVTFFMGLQSLGFYTAVAWLPSILARHGLSGTAAGWVLFYYQLIALTSSSLLPVLTRGRTDQRWTALVGSLVVAGGFALLMAVPSAYLVSCTLLGIGGGATLVLALTFQSQRAGSAGDAAALAGMAQSIGYLIAATGPLLLGILHQSSNGWTLPLGLLVALSVLMAGAGYQAGRDRLVGD